MNVLMTIINLIPALIAAIKAIEAAVPGSGKGEEKLAAVRGILEAVDASYASLWPKIQTVVSVLVALFNKTGAMPASGV
jgi:hypothetical protein